MAWCLLHCSLPASRVLSLLGYSLLGCTQPRCSIKAIPHYASLPYVYMNIKPARRDEGCTLRSMR